MAKVDDDFKSPVRPAGQPTTKKLPVHNQVDSRKPRAEQYASFDELDEIMNTTHPSVEETAVASPTVDRASEERFSDIDNTVNELSEEEEHLLNLHMTNIHANASLLSEETRMLASVQGEENEIDQYASRLGEILEQKTELINALQDRLGSFRELLRKEEELSSLY